MKIFSRSVKDYRNWLLFLPLLLPSCSCQSESEQELRRKALDYAQKEFKNDVSEFYRITEYLPYGESGCLSLGNNGRYYVILRGKAVTREGNEENEFKATFDVEFSGTGKKIRSILIDMKGGG